MPSRPVCAPCGSSNKCITDRPTDRPTGRQTNGRSLLLMCVGAHKTKKHPFLISRLPDENSDGDGWDADSAAARVGAAAKREFSRTFSSFIEYVSTHDNRVFNGPLGCSLRLFACTAHSTHSLRSATLACAVHRLAHSLRSLPRGTVEIHMNTCSRCNRVSLETRPKTRKMPS